eukprot:6183386-Ditylum_brightwellii.AAC.1
MPSAVSILGDAGESSTQPPSQPTLKMLKNSMPTMNDLTEVTDEKTLMQERTAGGEEHTLLVQQLTIAN